MTTWKKYQKIPFSGAHNGQTERKKDRAKHTTSDLASLREEMAEQRLHYFNVLAHFFHLSRIAKIDKQRFWTSICFYKIKQD